MVLAVLKHVLQHVGALFVVAGGSQRGLGCGSGKQGWQRGDLEMLSRHSRQLGQH